MQIFRKTWRSGGIACFNITEITGQGMNKIIETTMTDGALVAAGAVLSGCSMLFGEKAEDANLVPFSTISSGAYSGSLKNWDDKAQPVMCALIRSQSEWSYWFQPADNANAKHKFVHSEDAMAPKAQYFESRQLLLATRVIQAPDSVERDQIFTPEKVTMKNGVLQLNYRFNQPLSDATYKVKDFLLVEIPKERYTTGPVQFIENGRKVCEIGR